MDRRNLTQLTAVGLALGFGGPSIAVAQARKPEDGVDFVSLEKPAKTEAPAGKIEVVEFFWYKCIHCNRFEPELERWIAKLPKDVVFRRVPVAFNDDFVPQQRLFYTLEAMGLVEKLHRKVFAAIHEQKVKLDTGEQIVAWISEQGVDAAKFKSQYESFSTQTKVTRATQLQQAYKVGGVPSLGVAGKSYTDGALSQTMARGLQTVEWLVEQERLLGKGKNNKA